ncbi:hypothetical protein [Veillonella denticariosi]|uniref:hypothetical protein n=1 Tax=Veillonella denticariosi TaxID=419208 RepID=UPI00248F8B17|nr:hypothetical protein [Veillonella denticariosi]
MKANNEQMITLCAKYGLEGIDIVNELMRFKVLDQLISGNASSREWGVTAEDLYALAEKSTVESFGPIPYDVETFQALYGPSFTVELFDFISDTGILEGLDVGTIWETPVRESIEAHSRTGELVLYAYVEEYAGMVEEILQSYEDKKVVLYTASPVCYSILSRLYPMAQIIDRWPHRSYFDHIFTGTVGMFQSSEDIVEEVANGLHNLVPEGTAQLFLPATMAQNQLGLNNMALQFFLNQKRVESIREWTPLGAYEIVYGKAEVKKMRVGLRERVGDEWKAINYIPLPHGVFAQLPVFTVLNYGLSLRSILLPGGQTDVALGQDGIYCLDSRVSELGRAALRESGAYYLTFKRHSDYVEVGMTTDVPEDSVYWMFPDEELAYMWYTYFSSTIGQTLVQETSMLVQTEESFGYMLSSIRRRVLDVNDESALVGSVKSADEVYVSAVESANAEWQHTMDDLGSRVMPPTISIDIEDYSDYKK